jgi:hypothetical protein
MSAASLIFTLLPDPENPGPETVNSQVTWMFARRQNRFHAREVDTVYCEKSVQLKQYCVQKLMMMSWCAVPAMDLMFPNGELCSSGSLHSE